jgi:hypothetical protein
MIFRLWRHDDEPVAGIQLRGRESAESPAHPSRPEQNPPEASPPAERPIPAEGEPTPESDDNEI